VTFADAAGAQEYDVLGAFDECEAGELLDLRPWRATGETEIVLLERLTLGSVASFIKVSRCRSSRAPFSIAKSCSRKSA